MELLLEYGSGNIKMNIMTTSLTCSRSHDEVEWSSVQPDAPTIAV